MKLIREIRTFNERMHRAINDVTSTIETKRSAHTTVTSPLVVESDVTATISIEVTSILIKASTLPVTTTPTSVLSTEAVDIPVTSAIVTI